MEVEKRDGVSMGHQGFLFKISETCEYLKPRRRKSIGREPLTAEGQREFFKGAVREEAGAEALTSNNR